METDCFRLGVKFWGRVQGVGFRWNVKDVSSGYSVTGYVKNLSDGSVEMLAEGEEHEVRRTAVEDAFDDERIELKL